MNTDVAFHGDGTGIVGVVLRNSKGEVIAGATGPFDIALNTASAEALALLKGLELVEIGLHSDDDEV